MTDRIQLYDGDVITIGGRNFRFRSALPLSHEDEEDQSVGDRATQEYGRLFLQKRDGGEGSAFVIKGDVVFGSSHPADIRIKSSSLASAHARIVVDQDTATCRLVALSPFNPPKVNGDMVGPDKGGGRVLQEGDVILIGGRPFLFRRPASTHCMSAKTVDGASIPHSYHTRHQQRSNIVQVRTAEPLRQTINVRRDSESNSIDAPPRPPTPPAVRLPSVSGRDRCRPPAAAALSLDVSLPEGGRGRDRSCQNSLSSISGGEESPQVTPRRYGIEGSSSTCSTPAVSPVMVHKLESPFIPTPATPSHCTPAAPSSTTHSLGNHGHVSVYQHRIEVDSRCDAVTDSDTNEIRVSQSTNDTSTTARLPANSSPPVRSDPPPRRSTLLRTLLYPITGIMWSAAWLLLSPLSSLARSLRLVRPAIKDDCCREQESRVGDEEVGLREDEKAVATRSTIWGSTRTGGVSLYVKHMFPSLRGWFR
eukprot:CAMPEP_0185032078 /NCGR_PEP_ID=MMETSP1103-20130426/19924_1 /TAXON_ID=36769 /ORGANISM="Paraphysomonas bandaiensis, Strain Caron Lab Isolate" /LENGTH=476 /DNA_ID=CAMNT_0027567837 /DNA_START=307 /DNA_END=1737 /DNA_ORIENTATION=+